MNDVELFGIDEIAVVSWPGCTLDDPRVEKLAVALEDSPLFDRATTGPRVLKQLVASPLNLPMPLALERLQGFLVGADEQTTCIVLGTSATGRADRVATVREIVRRALAECELPAHRLRLAGPTVDAAAIDVESRRLLFQLAGISALVSFVVASLRLKSIRLAVMVLLGAVYIALVSIFLALLGVSSVDGETNDNSIAVFFMSALLVAFLFAPARHFLQHLSDLICFRY